MNNDPGSDIRLVRHTKLARKIELDLKKHGLHPQSGMKMEISADYIKFPLFVRRAYKIEASPIKEE